MSLQLPIHIKAPSQSSLTSGQSRLLQRKCARGTQTMGGECESCDKNSLVLQRKIQHSGGVPPIVHEVLNSPGQPLDATTRAFFEPRFGHDFSQVRVHTDSRAAESARVVTALAYTVGQNVVFGTLQYSPQTPSGQRLLAHELTHVMQQRMTAQARPHQLSVDPASSRAEAEANTLADAVTHGSSVPKPAVSSSGVQRACLSTAECGKVEGSLTNFVAKTEAKPENKSKADRRRDLCSKTPPDPKCTSGGHGSVATQLTALAKDRSPEQLGSIAGIFIDKDIPAEYGAYTNQCSTFTPPKPFPGKFCTFVPESLEKQAEQFNMTKNPTIGGANRQDWLTATLRGLIHETEHARFDAAPAIAKPSPTACDFNAISSNLTELAAITSEFKIVRKRLLAKPEKQRKQELDAWFKFWISSQGESISGTVKAVRCACECTDADEYIKKTVGFVTASWNTYELHTFHSKLRQPKWKLNWPIQPPSAIDVNDLPSAEIEVDVRDVPEKK